ncbi:MAG: glycosyltransferase [Chloroflexota bacterium]
MKALLICQRLGVGGAEELVLGASTHLHQVGVTAEVVALTDRGAVATEIEAAGVPLHLVTGKPGPRDPRAFARLVRLIRDRRPDVVHTYLLAACIYGRLAAMIARVPVIVASEQNVYRQKARRHAIMERALAVGTHRIIACCDTVARHYHEQTGVSSQQIATVYNAVRFPASPGQAARRAARGSLGISPDSFVIGTLGRLTEQKGHDILVDAMARGPLQGDAVAIIAGDGPLRSTLERRAADAGVKERTRFLGIRRDRDVLYAAMDAFVLPSRWEGLSLALVEAAGSGLPIVATTVGGNAEVVTDGSTGLLVPADDAEALARSLGRVRADRDLAGALGDRAAQDARPRFSIERHVQLTRDIYAQGLAARHGRPLERTAPA